MLPVVLIKTEMHAASKSCSFYLDSDCWYAIWHLTFVGYEDHHIVQPTMTAERSRDTTGDCLSQHDC